jgi:type VI secretion system secreted protein Hcp
VILIKFKKDIKGESTIKGYENWINVDSASFGVGRSVASVSEGTGKRDVSNPSLSELTFSRKTDLASPELFFQACGGQTLEECTIHLVQVVDNKPEIHQIILLSDPIVTSYHYGNGEMDSFTLNYTKVSYQYNSFDGKKVTAGTPKKWDLAKNITF